MYVVLRGRATFTLGDDEVDAPAGTIVFVRPGTKRGAIAAEDDTAVLAVGAKPGVVFEPSPWEDIFAAFSYAEKGEIDRAREMIDRRDRAAARTSGRATSTRPASRSSTATRRPASRTCSGPTSSSPERVAEAAAKDSDFDAVRDDPRVAAIAGEPDRTGPERATSGPCLLLVVAELVRDLLRGDRLKSGCIEASAALTWTSRDHR